MFVAVGRGKHPKILSKKDQNRGKAGSIIGRLGLGWWTQFLVVYINNTVTVLKMFSFLLMLHLYIQVKSLKLGKHID